MDVVVVGAFDGALGVNVRVTPICEVRFMAFRKTSYCAAPCGTTVGQRLLKVIGPPVTSVIVASATREVSCLAMA